MKRTNRGKLNKLRQTRTTTVRCQFCPEMVERTPHFISQGKKATCFSCKKLRTHVSVLKYREKESRSTPDVV